MLAKIIERVFPRTFTRIWNAGYDQGVTDAESGSTSY